MGCSCGNMYEGEDAADGNIVSVGCVGVGVWVAQSSRWKECCRTVQWWLEWA